MTGPRGPFDGLRAGLLLDLDDTLYDYAPCERAGRAAVLEALGAGTGSSRDHLEMQWLSARAAVQARLGATASSHSRLLWAHELLHRLGQTDRLGFATTLDRTYWDAFLDVARLRDGALELLDGWRGRGHKVAFVTDLTLELQLRKLERFGLLGRVDALAASEETPHDKPDPALGLLAIERLGVAREGCVVVGDNEAKDGGLARALGVPFVWVDPAAPDLRAVLARMLER